MLSIIPIKALNDNYIWLINETENNFAYVVDPGDADAVISTVTQLGLNLAGILITHHHWDHTQGISELQDFAGNNLPVYGPAHEQINGVNRPFSGHEHFKLAYLNDIVDVIAIPGHTSGHIGYHIQGSLFCGDTLFSVGCGRLFEGTPKQMLYSLTELTKLADLTKVYCAHEYTLANIKFALAVEPNNQALIDYQQWVIQQLALGLPSLPSTMGLEKNINPFLRCQQASVKAAVEQHCCHSCDNEEEVFKQLRLWKDDF